MTIGVSGYRDGPSSMGDASGQSKRDKLLELAKRKREEQVIHLKCDV